MRLDRERPPRAAVSASPPARAPSGRPIGEAIEKCTAFSVFANLALRELEQLFTGSLLAKDEDVVGGFLAPVGAIRVERR